MPSSELMDSVARFAEALDDEDYATLATILAIDCEYVTPKETIRGQQAVIASYETASVSAKSRIDKVQYESTVRSDPSGRTIVTFIDHLEHGGVRHTYACEQVVSLDTQGLVCRIVHRELPGQREALDVFLSRIKNMPSS